MFYDKTYTKGYKFLFYFHHGVCSDNYFEYYTSFFFQKTMFCFLMIFDKVKYVKHLYIFFFFFFFLQFRIFCNCFFYLEIGTKLKNSPNNRHINIFRRF